MKSSSTTTCTAIFLALLVACSNAGYSSCKRPSYGFVSEGFSSTTHGDCYSGDSMTLILNGPGATLVNNTLVVDGLSGTSFATLNGTAPMTPDSGYESYAMLFHLQFSFLTMPIESWVPIFGAGDHWHNQYRNSILYLRSEPSGTTRFGPCRFIGTSGTDQYNCYSSIQNAGYEYADLNNKTIYSFGMVYDADAGTLYSYWDGQQIGACDVSTAKGSFNTYNVNWNIAGEEWFLNYGVIGPHTPFQGIIYSFYYWDNSSTVDEMKCSMTDSTPHPMFPCRPGTNEPSFSPTKYPTSPSSSPTREPSANPTSNPSMAPTKCPTPGVFPTRDKIQLVNQATGEAVFINDLGVGTSPNLTNEQAIRMIDVRTDLTFMIFGVSTGKRLAASGSTVSGFLGPENTNEYWQLTPGCGAFGVQSFVTNRYLSANATGALNLVDTLSSDNQLWKMVFIPTLNPTQSPTTEPSANPTSSPSTSSPTMLPSSNPTRMPTMSPTCAGLSVTGSVTEGFGANISPAELYLPGPTVNGKRSFFHTNSGGENTTFQWILGSTQYWELNHMATSERIYRLPVDSKDPQSGVWSFYTLWVIDLTVVCQ